MKKQLIKILGIALALFISVGCTRNNGDIGPLWGLWRVTSMTIDGEVNTQYDGCLYFAFQSSVFSMMTVNEETHEQKSSYASWHYQGDDIIIDFCEPSYSPIWGTGLKKGQNLVVIESANGNEMVFSCVNSDDQKYVWALKKW